MPSFAMLEDGPNEKLIKSSSCSKLNLMLATPPSGKLPTIFPLM
jgi:hypothetical protein